MKVIYEKIEHKRIIHKPFNFGFKTMYDSFGEELHINLEIPGIFYEKREVKIFFDDGTILEADACYIIHPDYITIFEPMIVILEHQSSPVDFNKIKIISQYELGKIIKEKLPPLTVIASHHDKAKSVQLWDRTPSYTTKPLFLDLGREDNRKRLSSVSNIINNNEDLSIVDALNIGIIPLFAPRDKALEITEEVIKLYIKSDIGNDDLVFTLYSVLYAMIDAYSKYEDDFQRLISMINEKTKDEIIAKFDLYKNAMDEVKFYKQQFLKADERINNLESRNQNLESEKVEDRVKIDTLESENQIWKSKYQNLKKRFDEVTRKD